MKASRRTVLLASLISTSAPLAARILGRPLREEPASAALGIGEIWGIGFAAEYLAPPAQLVGKFPFATPDGWHPEFL